MRKLVLIFDKNVLRKVWMRVIPYIEPMLYIDPQAQVPEGYCETCGGACYGPSCTCLRCERDRP